MRQKIILFILLFSKTILFSQKSTLNSELLKCTNDSCKVKLLFKNGEDKLIYRISYWDTIRYLCEKNIAIKNELVYERHLSAALSNIGYIYQEKGQINVALECYFKSVKISDEIRDDLVSANTYNSIAYIYDHQNNFDNAVLYYNKSLRLYKKKKEAQGEAMLLNNIGFLYKSMGKYFIAEGILIESYNKYKSIKDELGEGILLNNLASLYDTKKERVKAKQYYLKSKNKFENLKHIKGLTTLYCNLGRIYLQEDSLKIAFEYATKSFEYAIKNSNPAEIRDASILLYQYYKKIKDIEKALYYHELYTSNKDSLNKKDLTTSIVKQQMKFELDKKMYADSLKHDSERLLMNVKIQNGTTQRYALLIVVFLISVLAYFLYKRYTNSKKNNKIIADQKQLVDEKQKEIVDSINYAKKIQEAIFIDKELKYTYFPEAFVLFQPKDIVSGDFYWYTFVNNKRIIAVADCTGHGVPGALMSMIGISFLNEIVIQQGVIDTAEILSQLRYKVINSLKQSSAADSSKDGMDIAILCIDDENATVEFSGANNPLWIIRKNELLQYAPDKRPIGYFLGKGLPFNKHVIEFKEGDLFYIFSDGYVDQFGGPKGKKYKHKQLKEILIRINALEMKEQESILLKEINNWKGELEQTDDICIIGIRM